MMEKFIRNEASEKEQLIHDLREIKSRFFEKVGPVEANDMIVDFAEYLQRKYPDATRYHLYHVLIGSSSRPSSEHFDFPGDDSVERYLREKQHRA